MTSLILLALVAVALGSSPVVEIPLYGNFSATFMYYTELSFPGGHTESVVIDTGSSDLLVSLSDCLGCQPPGDLPPSLTPPVPCALAHSRGLTCACSASGSLCVATTDYGGQVLEQWGVRQADVCVTPSACARAYWFGGVFNVTMQQQKYQQKNLQNSAYRAVGRGRAVRDGGEVAMGMWGLGYRGVTAANETTLFESLFSQGVVPHDMFSICLNRELGGRMSLGGVLPFREPLIEWTPMISSEAFYSVVIGDVRVGKESINVPPAVYAKHSIVDTGTPNPNLPDAAFAALKQKFLSLCPHQNLPGVCTGNSSNTIFDQACFTMTAQQIKSFPPIVFVLKGVELAYEAESFLTQQYFCPFGQVSLGLFPGGDWTVIGAQMMQQYVTIFDRANRRVGFSKAIGCPKTRA